jgi:hypothetical protein
MREIRIKKQSGERFQSRIVALYDEVRSRNPIYVSRHWQGEFQSPEAEVLTVLQGGIRDKNVPECTKRLFKDIFQELLPEHFPFSGKVEFHGRRGHLKELRIIIG